MDFSDFRLCEQRWFDDFTVGERFPLPSRTMTDALFAAFQLASGDNHPIHYDVEHCSRTASRSRSRPQRARACSRTWSRSRLRVSWSRAAAS